MTAKWGACRSSTTAGCSGAGSPVANEQSLLLCHPGSWEESVVPDTTNHCVNQNDNGEFKAGVHLCGLELTVIPHGVSEGSDSAVDGSASDDASVSGDSITSDSGASSAPSSMLLASSSCDDCQRRRRDRRRRSRCSNSGSSSGSCDSVASNAKGAFCMSVCSEDGDELEEIEEMDAELQDEVDLEDDKDDVLTAKELRLLVKYTSGFSMRRYKCPPHDCPMCTQAFYAGSGLRAAIAPSNATIGRAVLTTASSQLSHGNCLYRDVTAAASTCNFTKDVAAACQEGPAFYVDLSNTSVRLSVSYPDASQQLFTCEKLSPHCAAGSRSPQISPPPSPHLRNVPPPSSFSLPYKNWNDVPKLCLVPPTELPSFVQTHPPARPWLPLAHPERNKPTAIFSAMCYNILCDKYCTRQLYGYSPSWALNWEYRKKGIMEEIKHYAADIISLQEVEMDQFHTFFVPELEACGYQGIFAPKSRARTMSEHEKKYVDGCAIFWKRNKFQLYKEQKIEFNQLAIANSEGSEDMLNRVMTKDNIGLAAVLETKEGIYDNGVRPDTHVPKHLLVATVHVVWDPEFCDVKLIQTLMLMSELKNIIENLQLSLRPGGGPSGGKGDCSSMPMIFCGDLNSLPDSGVIEFLNAGKVSARHLEFKKYGYDMVLKAFSHTKDNDFLTHAFRLKQAYDESLMPYTNYTYDFKGIIDYIFYSEDHLNPLGVLGPIESSWFKENKVVGCPHPHVASDHFSLLVEFEMPILSSSQKNSGGTTAGSGPALRR